MKEVKKSSPKILIGIAGKAGSGKDTVGDILSNGEVYKFADPIKDIVCGLLDIHRNKLEDRDFKETIHPLFNKSPRELMQVIGTDLLRDQLDKGIWVKNMDCKYENSKGSLFVITDLRFKNEYDWIKEKGGIVIKVERPDNNLKQTNHISENDLDRDLEWDYVIENTGSLKELYVKSKEIRDKINKDREISLEEIVDSFKDDFKEYIKGNINCYSDTVGGKLTGNITFDPKEGYSNVKGINFLYNLIEGKLDKAGYKIVSDIIERSEYILDEYSVSISLEVELKE